MILTCAVGPQLPRKSPAFRYIYIFSCREFPQVFQDLRVFVKSIELVVLHN